MNSNNPPAVLLPLDEDMVKFLLDNCDANISMGLKLLTRVMEGDFSEDAAVKVIETNEKFKRLKKLIIDAQIDQ